MLKCCWNPEQLSYFKLEGFVERAVDGMHEVYQPHRKWLCCETCRIFVYIQQDLKRNFYFVYVFFCSHSWWKLLVTKLWDIFYCWHMKRSSRSLARFYDGKVSLNYFCWKERDGASFYFYALKKKNNYGKLQRMKTPRNQNACRH